MTEIKGYVEHIIYRNGENGYTVLSLTADNDEEIVCVGTFVSVNEGEYYTFEGEETVHPSYGTQFQVSKYEQSEPEDVIAITRYLGSGSIKGVGEALANRIVAKFGTDTFRVIEEEPELLVKVKGISERKAIEIHVQFHEKQEMREAMIFLQKYDISAGLAVKIYNFYGPALFNVIQTNPYKLAEDIQGVGFSTADALASRIGIEPDSEFRLKAGILYELGLASANGHCCFPKSQLTELSEQLLGVSATRLKAPYEDAVLEKKILIKEERGEDYVYLPAFYYMELNVARMLKNLKEHSFCDPETAKHKAETVFAGSGSKLDEYQRLAVKKAFCHGLFVLTGGPGTGKTTTIKAMLDLFKKERLEYLLAAPTGRAAKRMSEATGEEARTIHRLLEFSPGGNGEMHFERNEENPLEADAVIIDEMSMVDLPLMNALLKAITPGTRLILVGDEDQLPSVGAGCVLHDILSSDVFENVRLRRIFRQGEESHIITNAHKINDGEHPDLENGHPDFFLINRGRSADILNVTVALITQKLPKHLHCDPLDIQVLSPMKKGELGVENLNRVLQGYINPDRNGDSVESHGFTFREGDKVMQMKNNYDTPWIIRNASGGIKREGSGVLNGDMGIIRKINSFGSTVTIEYDDGRLADYTYAMMEEVDLAYAVTVHKSQGSEYPAVVLPLIQGPRQLFHRKILYTAVTRAKKCVAIVGAPGVVTGMIDNVREQVRYTTLCDRIQEICA